VLEVHSYPMKAVNRPGSSYASAALIVSSHAPRYAGVPGNGMIALDIVPLPKFVMISMAAAAPLPV